MPPALAKDLEYSLVRNERHTPLAWLPPNGPSPSTLVIIWLNIELRNTASKSSAAARALGLVIAPALRVVAATEGPMPYATLAPIGVAPMLSGFVDAITSPRCRPGSRL